MIITVIIINIHIHPRACVCMTRIWLVVSKLQRNIIISSMFQAHFPYPFAACKTEYFRSETPTLLPDALIAMHKQYRPSNAG